MSDQEMRSNHPSATTTWLEPQENDHECELINQGFGWNDAECQGGWIIDISGKNYGRCECQKCEHNPYDPDWMLIEKEERHGVA